MGKLEYLSEQVGRYGRISPIRVSHLTANTGESRVPRLDGQRLLIELLIAHQQVPVEDVVGRAWVVLEGVRRLLEHADLTDHVGDLKNESTM